MTGRPRYSRYASRPGAVGPMYFWYASSIASMASSVAWPLSSWVSSYMSAM